MPRFPDSKVNSVEQQLLDAIFPLVYVVDVSKLYKTYLTVLGACQTDDGLSRLDLVDILRKSLGLQRPDQADRVFRAVDAVQQLAPAIRSALPEQEATLPDLPRY